MRAEPMGSIFSKQCHQSEPRYAKANEIYQVKFGKIEEKNFLIVKFSLYLCRSFS